MTIKPWGKCPKCGYRRLSKVFLGWQCVKCGTSFLWSSKDMTFIEVKK